MSGPHDARAIANHILDIADEEGIPLTIMQLLKLVYLSHGWWLSFSEGCPLTKSNPQAWQYGPVHPEVYRAFPKMGRHHIQTRAVDPETGYTFSTNLSKDEDALIRQVVKAYGRHHAFTLSDMMHQPGTPWSETNSRYGDYANIPNDLMHKHFDELRQQRA